MGDARLSLRFVDNSSGDDYINCVDSMYICHEHGTECDEKHV
jgi:hypothetical protein